MRFPRAVVHASVRRVNGSFIFRPSTADEASHASNRTAFLRGSSSTVLEHPAALYNTLCSSRRGFFFSRGTLHERWDRLQLDLSALGRVSTGNIIVAYRNSEEAFRAMWDAIDAAKYSVLWQTYICKDDQIGRATVSRMQAAHRRGCCTELLYDCGGNITGRSRLVDSLRQCGANVIRFRPFFKHLGSYLTGGMHWERSPALRNHRKILLVDDRIGFCGGLNIGNEYCGVSEGGTGRFRDTHCAVTGPAVAHLREVYDDTKAPRPWEWSFARWRHIASAAVARRYTVGKNARDAFLLPVRRRGAVYLRRQLERAEHSTALIKQRIRWRKQRDQLERLEQFMHTYRQQHLSAAPSHESAPFTELTERRATECEEAHDADADADADADEEAETETEAEECNKATAMMKKKKEKKKKGPFRYRMGFRHVQQWPEPLDDAAPVPGAKSYGMARPVTTQVLSCNPRTRDWSIPYAFWQVSRRAHRRLWVTTPYYLPHRKLLRALLNAARRGVDVRILAGSSHTTDPWFMWYASNYITERLLAAGVRVYEYHGGAVMHAKTVVVDSIWASVGSYNWDMMSNKNMEVCVCHLSFEFAREMEKQFLLDIEESVEVRYEEHRQRSVWMRFASCVFYYGLHIAERLTFRNFKDADLSSKLSDVN